MAFAQPIPEKPRQFLPHRSVLVVTDDPENASGIVQRLQSGGYNTVTSIFTGSRLQSIPRQSPDIMIVHFTNNHEQLGAVSDALKQRYSGKNIPLIGVFSDQAIVDKTLFDTVMFIPVHPAQIAHRVAAMIRLNIMQTEISMRMDTLREDFGIEYRLNPESFTGRLRVLFIGRATPEFMIIINALEQRNVEVIAAFTSFTAFDFLHETTFDAVVINALSGMEPGLTISKTMRRNSALFHTPALLLSERGHVQTEMAYDHGVSDILYSDSQEKDIQDRILELARFHRLHRQVKAEFDNLGQAECLDESGTYSTEFFSKHLSRLVETYSEQDLPVTILSVLAQFDGAEPDDEESKMRVFNQLGSMIKNMVRVYDVTARLSKNVYVIAFPGQPASSLDPVVRRLSGIMDAAEFGPDITGKNTYRLTLQIDPAELGHGITGESWLAQQIPV